MRLVMEIYQRGCMCICELQLHRRYTGRRDDKGLGYTTATISSAHRVIVYARPDDRTRRRWRRHSQKRLVVMPWLAAAKSSGPGVTMCYAGARDGDMGEQSGFSRVFARYAASVLQAASSRELLCSCKQIYRRHSSVGRLSRHPRHRSAWTRGSAHSSAFLAQGYPRTA